MFSDCAIYRAGLVAYANGILAKKFRDL